MKQALGMIETKGLVALFEATDAMLKSANVSFSGWQTVGSGLVTAFVEGDVVRGMIHAGTATAAHDVSDGPFSDDVASSALRRFSSRSSATRTSAPRGPVRARSRGSPRRSGRSARSGRGPTRSS